MKEDLPEKQGLKLKKKYRVDDVAKMKEDLPEKQGLKPAGLRLIASANRLMKEDLPEKQGLKQYGRIYDNGDSLIDERGSSRKTRIETSSS